MTRTKKAIRKVVLVLISLLTLLLIWKSFIFCVETAKNGGADDYKMIFIANPFFFFLLGIIRFFTTRKLGLNPIYRIQDFINGIIILIPLFINNLKDSMNLGIILSLSIILFIAVETIYLLFKKFDPC
jgi:hypothetical protein